MNIFDGLMTSFRHNSFIKDFMSLFLVWRHYCIIEYLRDYCWNRLYLRDYSSSIGAITAEMSSIGAITAGMSSIGAITVEMSSIGAITAEISSSCLITAELSGIITCLPKSITSRQARNFHQICFFFKY